MKQSELIAAVAATSGQSKLVTENVIKALGEVTQKTLKAGDEIVLNGIGKLSVVAKPARPGRNPSTGLPMVIAARNSAKFTVAKALKDSLA